ncbi:ABC transporter ATP-binding protein [Clostridiisalibacter paucivorans]|uniref:ABC transporter ATP-binding protein n=1 Tax=Clostridiisalibacter paucivorans TaxID=408753 RepID=UPI00047E8BBD|nr:ABC transporter ATP-binding protein [Clostridiisalibacter paucivorans]
MHLKVEQLKYRVEDKIILKDIDMYVNPGEFIGLVGPNGSGKSTLLKNIYKVLKPTVGNIYLDDYNLNNMSNKEVSKKLAVVSQEFDSGFDFSVEEIVTMGRYPQKSFYETSNKEDREIVLNALRKVGMFDFVDRSFFSLSGGEKQRVLIARALAQKTDFIIMDEPTNHLDIGYQIQIMDLIKDLQITTLTAIHDLNMAVMYCDRIYVMKEGKIIISGNPKDILDRALIKDVFNVDSHIRYNGMLKRIQIDFISKKDRMI